MYKRQVVELLAGDKPYKLGDEDFRIDFMVMASRYTVGRTGGVCERCSVDGNKIRCFMDGHGLQMCIRDSTRTIGTTSATMSR